MSSGCRGARCCARSSRGRATPRRSRSWPGARCAGRFPPSARLCTGASGRITPSSSGRSWRSSRFWMRRWCPGNNESGGRHGSGKTRKGSKWLHTYLTEAAKAAARTKGTYLGAQYARLRGRRGPARATVAVGHSILVAAYHILDRHEPYRELGPDYFRRRHSPEHQTRRLVRQIEALGYHVRLEEVA